MLKKKCLKKALAFFIVSATMIATFLIQKTEMFAEGVVATQGTLIVENTFIMYDHKLVVSELKDGSGGSISYDKETNTLTLDNYHFNTLGPYGGFIYALYMSENKPFRIVLKGSNIMRANSEQRKDEKNNEGIDLRKTSAVIEGNGELTSNMGFYTSEELTIRDCDLIVNGYSTGIACNEGELHLENAYVRLSTEEPAMHAAALRPMGAEGAGGKMSMKNSCLLVEAKGGNFQSVLIRMDIPKEYLQSGEALSKLPADYMDDASKHLQLSDDITVTDEQGNNLNLCAYQWISLPWYVFSKEGKTHTYVTEDQISRSVYFRSMAKQKQIDAINKAVTAIDAIGEVTLEKEPLIVAARMAYGSLDSLGDKAAYAKEKVRNYNKLTDAEAMLQKLKEAAGKGGTEEETGDKEVLVNGIKYFIKTPKIKSLKSKKKSSATIIYTKDMECSGYQISYSTNKKFKKAKTKTKTIKNCKTKKKSIKALKAGKRYYFRVRAFKKIEGKKYYGNWSKVKKVKIK
ncbi:MAG: hypothetical protein K5739_01800 [Lachnospiraceae bacterium]|nr:hypothetical protein [Lachnospiraceae bacterium]